MACTLSNKCAKKKFLNGQFYFNLSSKTWSHVFLEHSVVLPYQTLWQYFDGDPLTGTKIAIFDQYLILTGGVNKFPLWSMLITASVDFSQRVYAKENTIDAGM